MVVEDKSVARVHFLDQLEKSIAYDEIGRRFTRADLKEYMISMMFVEAQDGRGGVPGTWEPEERARFDALYQRNYGETRT